MDMLGNIEQLVKLVVYEEIALPRLAKVISTDSQEYYCDCVSLDQNGNDSQEIYTRVLIPKLWGTTQGGIFAFPEKGTVVLINFINGDKNLPVISAVIGSNHKETINQNSLIIQNNNAKIKLDEKVSISSGNSSIAVNNNGTIDIKNSTASLASLLKEITNGISQLTTIDPMSGTTPLTPDQITKWQLFSTKIDQLLG